MKILEAKEEIIDVGPREPPSLKVEKTPSLGSEENAEAKNVLANGAAVLNGEEHQLRRIENGGEKKRKTSAASSSTCGTQVEDRRRTGPVTTLLLQLTTNNNNKENGDQETFSPPPPKTPLLEVFQATVVESSGDGCNGVFYERRVDDVIVVDADKRLFYCVRDAIDQTDEPIDAREVLRAKAKEQREKLLLRGLQQRGEKQESALPASAIAAARRWRRKQRVRRQQRQQRQQQQEGESTDNKPTGDLNGGTGGSGIVAACPRHGSNKLRSATNPPPKTHQRSIDDDDDEDDDEEAERGEGRVRFQTPPPTALNRTHLGRADFQPAMSSIRRCHMEQQQDIEERILRRREMVHLFQWYYPEGGWGFVVLGCACVSHALAFGLQLGFGFPLAANVAERFSESGGWGDVSQLHLGTLFSASVGLSLLASPPVVAFCQSKSTRLAAVVGALVLALGLLFTSFAVEFSQLYCSFGTVIALGVALVRDSGSLMVGQYFRRRRDAVEAALTASAGIGIAAVSWIVDASMRLFSWRHGLQVVTGAATVAFFLGLFYRSATLYHPQRRAILHLKSLRRKITLKGGHGGKAAGGAEVADFSNVLVCLRRRSVQTLILAGALAAFGIYSPLVYLTPKSSDGDDPLARQIYLGLAWSAGCGAASIPVLTTARDCVIGKVRLLECVLFLAGAVFLAHGLVEGRTGAAMFTCAYGFVLGAYHYVTKICLFDRVKSRDFGQAWSVFLLCQSVPAAVGIPAVSILDDLFADSVARAGSVVGGVLMLIAFVVVFISNCVREDSSAGSRPRMRHKRTQTQVECTCSSKSGGDADVVTTDIIVDDDDEEFDSEFDEEDDEAILKAMLLAQEYYLLYGDEGNITSCAKVEHDLMFSEFQQNLFKEAAANSIEATSRSAEEDSSSEAIVAAAAGVGGKTKGSCTRSASKLNPRRLWSIRRQSTENISLSSSSMTSAANSAAVAERVPPAISEQAPIEESVDEDPLAGNSKLEKCKRQDFFSVIDEVSSESKPVSENNVSVV